MTGGGSATIRAEGGDLSLGTLSNAAGFAFAQQHADDLVAAVVAEQLAAVLLVEGDAVTLWQPFAPRLDGAEGARSVWKNLSGSRIRLREVHAGGQFAFEQEWAGAAGLGLVRSARLHWLGGDGTTAPPVQVLDEQPHGW